eukprot:3942189-Amphidinium_carterae.1
MLCLSMPSFASGDHDFVLRSLQFWTLCVDAGSAKHPPIVANAFPRQQSVQSQPSRAPPFPALPAPRPGRTCPAKENPIHG